jgi:hypothetical protein
MWPEDVERSCRYAPRHRPDESGRCAWCQGLVCEPWFMRRRPSPPQLVAEVAARHGVLVDIPLAAKIAEVLLGYADTALAVRELVSRQLWERPEHVARVRERMRRALFTKLADEGFLPTALPSESVTYFDVPSFSAEHQRIEVPSNAAAAGVDWFEVEIELRVAARRPVGGS